jgi:hypothetical protein
VKLLHLGLEARLKIFPYPNLLCDVPHVERELLDRIEDRTRGQLHTSHRCRAEPSLLSSSIISGVDQVLIDGGSERRIDKLREGIAD